MKAILEFDMNLSHDRHLHKLALNGDRTANVIAGLENVVKGFIDNDEITVDEANGYRKVMRTITELKQVNECDL